MRFPALAAPGKAGTKKDAESGAKADPHGVLGESEKHDTDRHAKDQTNSRRDRFSGVVVLVLGHPGALLVNLTT